MDDEHHRYQNRLEKKCRGWKDLLGKIYLKSVELIFKMYKPLFLNTYSRWPKSICYVWPPISDFLQNEFIFAVSWNYDLIIKIIY